MTVCFIKSIRVGFSVEEFVYGAVGLWIALGVMWSPPDLNLEKSADKTEGTKYSITFNELKYRSTIVSTPARGADPGGTVAIGEVVDTNLETEINGLYVADASVFPKAPGSPPVSPSWLLQKGLLNI